MTKEHYDHLRTRVKKEIRVGITSSIWLVLALASLTFAGSLQVTLMSAALSTATTGEVEVGRWACLLIALIFVVVHVVFWRDSARRADETVKEMDLYKLGAVLAPQAQASLGGGWQFPAPDEAAREPRQDRQIDMQSDPLDAANSEREH